MPQSKHVPQRRLAVPRHWGPLTLIPQPGETQRGQAHGTWQETRNSSETAMKYTSRLRAREQRESFRDEPTSPPSWLSSSPFLSPAALEPSEPATTPPRWPFHPAGAHSSG